MKKILLVLMLSVFSLNAEDIMILAAASLKFVLNDIKVEFLKNRPNDKIEVSYIASGKAYNQIINGAPAHLFIAADTSYPQKLYKNKGTPKAPTNYAKGKLVLFSMDKNLVLDSLNVLKNENLQHIALPNPKLAPYGVAGKEALEKANLYKAVEKRLVLGESIAQAYQYVKSGGSEVGFNALSMVIKDENANYLIIDEKSYTPILQAFVITNHGKDSKLANDFAAFLTSPKAQEIFASYGYDKP